MGPLGFNEILIILVIVLLLFGGRKIPELMRGLGRGIREFNDAKSNVRREIEEGVNEKDQMDALSYELGTNLARLVYKRIEERGELNKSTHELKSLH